MDFSQGGFYMKSISGSDQIRHPVDSGLQVQFYLAFKWGSNPP